MARAITCWVCRGPHSKAKHRKARELRPARKASRRRAPSAGGAGPANALWKRVNAIIDRLGEHKLSDATAPMKTGGFFSVRGRYALEFARALRMARIPFRQKLVGGSPTFYLTVAAPKSRRNPAAMDGHVFVVIAHGKNGEVGYRGREAHLSYGAAWREAQIVARRRGLTDVHIVKDGKDIVGEVKARTNPNFGWDVVYRKRGSLGPWRYWMSSTSKIAADALASQETGRLKSREFRVIEARGEYIPTMNAPVLAHHGRNRPNPNYKPGPHSCRLCGDEIGEEEVADGQEYGYGNLCWRCDFEQHSGISHFNRDRSNGPPVFDGTWRFPRYDDRRALIAAYRRGRI